MARRDRKPIVFPMPSHANPKLLAANKKQPSLFSSPKLKPWRAAREIIDWSIEGESIFSRKRPLAENTMRRIFAGLKKFCGLDFFVGVGGPQGSQSPRSVNDPMNTILGKSNQYLAQPYVVVLRNNVNHSSIDEPLRTLTTLDSIFGVAQPYLVAFKNNMDGKDIDSPLNTLTTKEYVGLANPYIINMAHTQSPDNSYVKSVEQPLGVQTGKGCFALINPYLVQFYGNSDPADVEKPLNAVTTKDRFGVVEPYLVEFHGNHKGQADGENRTRDLSNPLPTADCSNRFALAEPYLVKYFTGSDAESINRPLSTVTANYEHLGLAQPFLIQFFSERDGQLPRTRSIDKPLWTVTAQGRMALVEPSISETGDNVHSPIFEIIGKLDIKFRMLQPHELAAAMSFPKSYSFSGNRAEQVKQIGNAVPCNLAAALCRSLIETKASAKKRRVA